MSDEDVGDVFDVDRVRDLVQLMIEHGLTEVDLRQHGQTIRLRRGGEAPSPPYYSAPPPLAPSPPRAAPEPQGADSRAASEDNDADYVLIRSPMVGTFYSRPNPDSKSFVQIGQEITADTTVCIIEAMKVFNEIPAEVAGKVVAILVENEEPVEFGKPLIKIRPLS